MKILITVAIVMALAIAATTAQQAQPTPTEQAMGQRIYNEVAVNIRCETAAVTLQKQVADLQAKVKELEAAKPPVPENK